tara:strand:+ start:389 stop:619 length:231 start_codon:yes stop_codon:yes gene_type:complete
MFFERAVLKNRPPCCWGLTRFPQKKRAKRAKRAKRVKRAKRTTLFHKRKMNRNFCKKAKNFTPAFLRQVLREKTRT